MYPRIAKREEEEKRPRAKEEEEADGRTVKTEELEPEEEDVARGSDSPAALTTLADWTGPEAVLALPGPAQTDDEWLQGRARRLFRVPLGNVSETQFQESILRALHNPSST
jgi:hypothetical protein